MLINVHTRQKMCKMAIVLRLFAFIGYAENRCTAGGFLSSAVPIIFPGKLPPRID